MKRRTDTAFAPILAHAQHRDISPICKTAMHALLAYNNADGLRRRSICGIGLQGAVKIMQRSILVVWGSQGMLAEAYTTAVSMSVK